MSSQPRPEGTWAVITYLPVMKSVIFAYNFRIVWPKWIRLAFYHHETWYVTSTMALAEYIHIHIQLCENKRLLQNYPFLWIYCLWTVLFYSISNWPDSKYKYCHLKHLLVRKTSKNAKKRWGSFNHPWAQFSWARARYACSVIANCAGAWNSYSCVRYSVIIIMTANNF